MLPVNAAQPNKQETGNCFLQKAGTTFFAVGSKLSPKCVSIHPSSPQTNTSYITSRMSMSNISDVHKMSFIILFTINPSQAPRGWLNSVSRFLNECCSLVWWSLWQKVVCDAITINNPFIVTLRPTWPLSQACSVHVIVIGFHVLHEPMIS